MDAVDLFEINEAFSGSTVAVMRSWGSIPVRSTSTAAASPWGIPSVPAAAGVLVTLLHEMIKQDKKIGLASLCLGGGEAVALVVRR